MDMRQVKTREAIFSAFKELLAERDCTEISVGTICERAGVGRTTFYAHFSNKEALLDEVCTSMFQHVFNTPELPEAAYDFSGQSSHVGATGIEASVTHLLHHIADNDLGVADLLRGHSGELVATQFRRALYDLARNPNGPLALASTGDVPASFTAHHFAVSLIGAIHWWVMHGMCETPEQIATWFVQLISPSS